jgi:hypothetical protein
MKEKKFYGLNDFQICKKGEKKPLLNEEEAEFLSEEEVLEKDEKDNQLGLEYHTSEEDSWNPENLEKSRAAH